MPQVGELTIFFLLRSDGGVRRLDSLWYKTRIPAEVFMGGTWDRWRWGGAIGTVAVVIKQELLLPFIGGVFCD